VLAKALLLPRLSPCIPYLIVQPFRSAPALKRSKSCGTFWTLLVLLPHPTRKNDSRCCTLGAPFLLSTAETALTNHTFRSSCSSQMAVPVAATVPSSNSSSLRHCGMLWVCAHALRPMQLRLEGGSQGERCAHTHSIPVLDLTLMFG
jgi:hypothetical protein